MFYNHEDIWTVAQQSRAQAGQQGSDAIEPLYILMQFPGRNHDLSLYPSCHSRPRTGTT